VRPYQSDIGIVGRSGDKYTLFVGGRVLGDRLNVELADLVPRGALVATLRPLLHRFKDERDKGEGFGDWCQRRGVDSLKRLLRPQLQP
jgi:sulfite reductase (ferredoxin)